MIRLVNRNKRPFYVVQFIELPFEGIDDYVCVPNTWLIVRRATDTKAVVAYPKDEDPFDTRDRAMRKERCDDEWRFYMAVIKYESDTYKDAEFWIATRNDYGPLVDEDSKTKDTLPKFTLDKKLRSANRNSSSKSKKDKSVKLYENPRKPLPRISIKRPALSEPKEQRDEKRLKLKEAESRESRIDDASNIGLSTIHPNSQNMSAPLYNHMIGSLSTVPIKKRIHLANIARTLASQNPSYLMNQTRSTRPVEEQQSMITQSQSQDVPRVPEMRARNSLDHTAPLRGIAINFKEIQHVPRISVGRSHDVTAVDTIDALQSAANVASDTQNLRSLPRQCPGFDRRSDGQRNLTVQEDFLQQTTYVPDLAPRPSGSQSSLEELTINEAFTVQRQPNPAANQSSEYLLRSLQNSYLPVNQDKFQQEQHRQELHCSSTESIPDKPTTVQNSASTTHQTHNRVVLEQQMLDHFATLFTQMGSTLRYTCDMYNNLRSSILETAQTYRHLLDAVERFNTLGNSASDASPSSSATPEVPQDTEEIQNEEAARNSGYTDQQNNNVVNEAPKNKWRFVLPPEYDLHDTRWTLKYRKNMPGLVELVPQSGIYVGYGELKYSQQVSKDCKSLVRLLLPEVFKRDALSVCLSVTEKAQASDKVGTHVRPELDEHACMVLINFVLEYGLKCGWDTDVQPILSGIHSVVRKNRFKYGVSVRCN